MNPRSAADLAVALGAAVILNLILVAGAALLAVERPLIQEMTTPTAVNLVTLPPPDRPPPQRRTEEPRPQEPPRVDFQPELPSPALAGMPAPRLQVVLDPDLFAAPPAAADLVFFAGDLDQPPQPVYPRAEPLYPMRARQRDLEGEVKVKLLVRRDGSVGEFEILEGRPAGVFEESVRKVVPLWRFQPGRIEGQAVDCWVVTSVIFDLGE